MKKDFFTRFFNFFLLIVVFFLLPSCDMANDETPPEDVSNLSFVAKGESVEFSWTNPSDSDFSYVEIRTTARGETYYHTSIVPGKATTYTVNELTNNVEYEFNIICYDTSKNHSAGITAISVPSGLGDVRNVSYSSYENEITVSWTNPKDRKFAGIELTVVNENVPEEFEEQPLVEENLFVENSAVESLISESLIAENDFSVSEENLFPEEAVAEEITEQTEPSVQEEDTAVEEIPAQETVALSEEESVVQEVFEQEESFLEQTTDEVTEEDSKEVFVEEVLTAEEETEELSEEEITDLLLKNKRVEKKVKHFHKLTVHTDDTVINSYKFSDLESGSLYTVTLTAYDIDGNYSAPYTFHTELPAETDGLEYSLTNDGAAYIVTSFKGDNTSEHVITPEEENGHIENPITVTVPKIHNEKPVTAIGTAAFKDCRGITEIILPSTITSIGKNAFENCVGLEGVIIPENTALLDEGSFWNCLNLKWLVIPESVKKIGLGAILNDTKLTTIFYTGSEEQWKLLEKNIDSGNASLKNFTKRILSKPAEIRFNYDETTPIELVPPEKVGNIVAEGGNCYVLLSWNNPSDKDFDGVKIEAVDAEDNIIGRYFVSSLQNSFIVTGLENEKTYSFTVYSFDKLKNYSEPVKTRKIKTELITNVDEDGFYYFINTDGISCSVCGSDVSKQIVAVPESISNYPVTQISQKSFANDELLEIVILPETITVIAEDSFENCNNLSNIYFCGSYSQWEEIDGIEELDTVLRTDFVFDENDSVAPSEVKLDFLRRGDRKIGFDLSLPSDSDFYKIILELDGESAEAVKAGEYSYVLLNLENDIKHSVCIKTKDIYGNVSEGITFTAEAGELLTEGVTSDGFHFVLCENESELSGTSYKIISYENKETIFADEAVSIVFPETIDDVVVTEIDSNVFAGCSNIESIEFPSTVVSIGNGVLCLKSLKHVYVNPANKVYSLNVDGTILYSKKGNQKKLEQVLPCVSGTVDFTGIQLTEISSGAFAECRKVTKVILSSRLKKIGDYAFRNCSMLSAVYLPASLKTVGKNVFEGCEKLTACNYQGTKNQFNKIEIINGEKKILSLIKYLD